MTIARETLIGFWPWADYALPRGFGQSFARFLPERRRLVKAPGCHAA